MLLHLIPLDSYITQIIKHVLVYSDLGLCNFSMNVDEFFIKPRKMLGFPRK